MCIKSNNTFPVQNYFQLSSCYRVWFFQKQESRLFIKNLKKEKSEIKGQGEKIGIHALFSNDTLKWVFVRNETLLLDAIKKTSFLCKRRLINATKNSTKAWLLYNNIFINSQVI